MPKVSLSPFRYPGAKSRMMKLIVDRIASVMSKGSATYVEPFVGGGSVLLGVANAFPDLDLVVNDDDGSVSSFWKCIVDDNICDELVDKIKKTIPTVEEHSRQRELVGSSDILEAGYAALFLNRTSFSGILTAGPIGGKGQTSKYSVGCRYNSERLSNQINVIREELRGRLKVCNIDFGDFLLDRDDGSIVYCDPPYYVKGGILYPKKMSHNDHVRLQVILRSLKKSKFVLSYDDVKEVTKLYEWANVDLVPVRYSIKGLNRESWNSKFELLIDNGKIDSDEKRAEIELDGVV